MCYEFKNDLEYDNFFKVFQGLIMKEMHWKNREVLIFSSLQKPSWKQLCTEIWRLFFLSFFVLLQKKLGINLIQMQAACNNNLIMVDKSKSTLNIWILVMWWYMDHWLLMPELRGIFLNFICEEIFKNGSNIIWRSLKDM